MHKTTLRTILKNHAINLEKKEAEEKYLLATLSAVIDAQKPTCIGLYSPIEHEVDLSCIFEKAREQEIVTAYPRITGDVITFHMINSPKQLSSTSCGICEPCAMAPLVVPDVLVVPGLAFTKDGKRLGRGKGHYDRYLSQYSPYTISLAFSWQLLDDLPTEGHDMPIDRVIYSPY